MELDFVSTLMRHRTLPGHAERVDRTPVLETGRPTDIRCAAARRSRNGRRRDAELLRVHTQAHVERMTTTAGQAVDEIS